MAVDVAAVAWIPTSFSVPVELHRVLVAVIPGTIMVGVRDKDGVWRRDTHQGAQITDTVTHWSLLPELPG